MNSIWETVEKNNLFTWKPMAYLVDKIGGFVNWFLPILIGYILPAFIVFLLLALLIIAIDEIICSVMDLIDDIKFERSFKNKNKNKDKKDLECKECTKRVSQWVT